MGAEAVQQGSLLATRMEEAARDAEGMPPCLLEAAPPRVQELMVERGLMDCWARTGITLNTGALPEEERILPGEVQFGRGQEVEAGRPFRMQDQKVLADQEEHQNHMSWEVVAQAGQREVESGLRVTTVIQLVEEQAAVGAVRRTPGQEEMEETVATVVGEEAAEAEVLLAERAEAEETGT